MSRIRSKDMKPEMFIRRLIHSMGYRYRLHRKDLPGKPDLVFPGKKKIIFVHGCFWHQHDSPDCKIARLPKSKQEYWVPKLKRNKTRDYEQQLNLKEMGWGVLVIWECELKYKASLTEKIKAFLDS